MPSRSVPAAEIAERLREVIRGELYMLAANSSHTWNSTGDMALVEFLFGGWRITFCKKANKLFDIDSATAPSEDIKTPAGIAPYRRCSDAQFWRQEIKSCPLTLLSKEDRDAIEKLLQETT